MARGCPLIYIGKECGEWENFPDDCMYMRNEGKRDNAMLDFVKTKDIDWRKDFLNHFTSPNGVYCECVMATAICEAIKKSL